jgi:hypothetical protein
LTDQGVILCTDITNAQLYAYSNRAKAKKAFVYLPLVKFLKKWARTNLEESDWYGLDDLWGDVGKLFWKETEAEDVAEAAQGGAEKRAPKRKFPPKPKIQHHYAFPRVRVIGGPGNLSPIKPPPDPLVDTDGELKWPTLTLPDSSDGSVEEVGRGVKGDSKPNEPGR